ncbi:phosphoglycerol transferase MdoB-like AlkP superfamily enzyme [Bradymonas sediminis]|uniref:Sulfatase n=2 Tax=Bradymonas sediminis TaxID=1548548 RepID=A0A2Z4FHJ4_9DELT|nr:sulfatase [Bradymonas sediminis]TDP77599.1 phosphoglycerol transferase MdoB-like AlkP superfamily enzyme [Bradymonas sediminis]
MSLQKYMKQLDSLEWGYLLGAALPGAILVLVLNLVRLAGDEVSRGLLGSLDMLKSEVFLLLGLAAGGLALLRFMRARSGRAVALFVMQVLWAIIAFFEVAGHQFFITTGSVLDYYLLAFSLGNLSDNAEVISSEVPLWIYIAVPLVTVSILCVPWLIRSFLATKGHAQDEDATAQQNLPLLPTAVLSFLLIFASTLPAYSSQATHNARATTPTIAVTAIAALSSSMSTVEEAKATTLDIHLKPRETGGDNGAHKQRNVVFLVLESTRASAMTVYDETLETTPFLAELAKRSTVAEKAYVQVPHSSKALTSILCGITPNLHMPITEAIEGNIPGRCLADLLGEQGYSSLFIQSAVGTFENRYQLVENFGFDEFISGNELDSKGFEKANYFGYEDDIMLKPSRKWLEANKNKPIFATYFTLTPHHQYLAPRRYGRHPYAEDDLLNRYLNTIHYVDNFVKNVLDQFKELGLYEDTIFVIVGDHGEGLGEHDRFQHDNVIYQEGVRVPFLIYDPQDPQPRRVKYNVNHLDVVPSVIKRLGYEVLDGDFPGMPILEVEEERPMRINCWYERRCMAQIIGDQKYIHHFDSQPDEYFDLSEDPDERNDIANSRDDLSELRRDLLDWRREIIGMHRSHAERIAEDVLFESLPDVQHQLDAQFGDVVKLRGYDITAESTVPGGRFTVTWYFEAVKKLNPDLKLFVHLEGPGKMKNLDHAPAQGLFPLEDWKPGTIIADKQVIRVPRKWKTGDLKILLGFWNAKTGERMEITGTIPTDGNNRAMPVTMPVQAK